MICATLKLAYPKEHVFALRSICIIYDHVTVSCDRFVTL